MGTALVVVLAVAFRIVFDRYQRRKDMPQGQAQETGAGVPEALTGADEPAGKQPLFALRLLTAMLAVAGCAGLFAANTPLGGWLPFCLVMLPVAAVLCGAILISAYRALKGTPAAAGGFIEMTAYAPVLAFSLFGVLTYANERFDPSDAQTHDALLTKRHLYEWGGRKPITPREPRYLLVFESWRSWYHEEVTVPFQTYHVAREGQIWRLRVRRGLLGYAWVESMQPHR